MTKRTILVAACVLGIAAVSSAQQRAAVSKDVLARQLDEIGRVATVMVDGDLCRRIVTSRALEFMNKLDPKDPYLGSDNYDVDDEAFNVTKKTLIRLSRLASFPADVNLWLPVAGRPGRVQVVIRNVNEMSQFWRWGELSQDMPPAMKTVLETGRRTTVTVRPGWVSVLAPVYDSLGDIVGLVEAVAQEQADLRENVK